MEKTRLALQVRSLSKRYRIGQREPYQSLRDVMARPFANAVNGIKRAASPKGCQDEAVSDAPDNKYIWAIKDISFTVQPGEIVGVIGRNGAGKTTLLKILSRVTEPTRGHANLYGRVGALLEVGTGFHPELTGRENIFLSGVILGMKRRDIKKRFDEIVAFAEVEKFIDTPLKRYSSGMYTRLAFAIPAFLEEDIMLVDEILAVGDARFQKKCLKKMEEAGASGRTVLFVSHNMSSVIRLCHRVLLLDQGKLIADGPTQEVVHSYLQSSLGTTARRAWEDETAAPGNNIARLRSVRIRNEEGETTETLDIRKPIGIEMEYDVLQSGRVLIPNFHFFNEEGLYLFVAAEMSGEWHEKPRPCGRHVSTAWIPGNLLSECALMVGAALTTLYPLTVHFHEKDVVAFQVKDSMEGGSARGDYPGEVPGVIRPLLKWSSHLIAREQPVSIAQSEEERNA